LTPSRLRVALDFLSDCALVGFATWTLVAYLGMLTKLRVTVLVPLWLVLFAVVGALVLRFARGVDTHTVRGEPRGETRWTLLVVGVAAGLLSAIIAIRPHGVPWAVIWAFAALAVGAALAARTFSYTRGDVVDPPGRLLEDATAALVGLVFGGMSLFIYDPNADDVFYVNRATATAQLNHIPARDVIFTHETAKRFGGAGLPVDAYSAFQGALGHVVGVQGASMAYYVFPPVFTFLAVWAVWRLLRRWAPRWPLLCFGLGCIYLLWSAQLELTPGGFFLTRMWQGKVAFASWLVPMLYVLITRWLGDRDARTGVLLVAAGVAGLGLTSSAAFVVPLIAATTLPALLATRDWSAVPVLAVTAGFPFLVAFGVSRSFPVGNRFPFPGFPTEWYYHAVLGASAVAIAGAAGIWLAPWFARRGPPAAVATGVALVAAVLLAPGVLHVLNDVSGLSGSRALRRTLWVIPFPAVVGLLAAAPYDALTRRAALRLRVPWAAPVAGAAAIAALLIAFGHPLWLSHNGNSLWVARPTWKTNQYSLRLAREILRSYKGSGPILVDRHTMRAVSLVTVEPKAVMARSWYARQTDEPPARTRTRIALADFIMGEVTLPPSELQRDLADIRVGLVCVRDEEIDLKAAVEETGDYRESFRVRGKICLARRPGMPPV
jgi:hypothetical protein